MLKTSGSFFFESVWFSGLLTGHFRSPLLLSSGRDVTTVGPGPPPETPASAMILAFMTGLCHRSP